RLIIPIAAARLPDAQWMYAGSLPGVVSVCRNFSGTAGSGDAVLNGMLKNLMPASFAAAASSSMLAPCSVGTRRLMIDANPIFFSSGTAAAVVAPPHATVVSRRAKFVTPGIVSFVTCCAAAVAATSASAIERHARMGMAPSRRIMLRNAVSAPPREISARQALRDDERAEAEGERQRNHRVPAAQIGVGRHRKLRREADRHAADKL